MRPKTYLSAAYFDEPAKYVITDLLRSWCCNLPTQAITVDFYHTTNQSQAIKVDLYYMTNRSQAKTVDFYHTTNRLQVITVDFGRTTNRVCMSVRLIGGLKSVGCYQTYLQTCMAAVCTWVRTLGRFTTFDGLSGAVIFHMSQNTEVLPITVYAGPHPTN